MNILTELLGINKSLKPDGFPFVLKHIQTIRLAMALLEIEPLIRMPRANKNIFDHLNKYFDYPVQYYTHSWQVSMRDDIAFNHEKPSVTINQSTYPLVFPRQMLTMCQAKWCNSNKITFSGFKTEHRIATLKSWLNNTFDKKIALEEENSFAENNVFINWSDKGRQFPQKAWDEGYYNELLGSGFVLCPDGDFIWTYRFFESVICGAIPIIENMCPHYEGFYFFDMKTPKEELIYRPQMAKENFKLLMQKFTLPEKMNA